MKAHTSTTHTGTMKIIWTRLTRASWLSPALLACLFSALVHAGEADVIDGSISSLGGERYHVEATVQHTDSGWDHYADRWDVLDANGVVLGTRELAHPHVQEQPFTRALTLTIPKGVTVITLQAHDSVHGLGGKTFQLQVPIP